MIRVNAEQDKDLWDWYDAWWVTFRHDSLAWKKFGLEQSPLPFYWALTNGVGARLGWVWLNTLATESIDYSRDAVKSFISHPSLSHWFADVYKITNEKSPQVGIVACITFSNSSVSTSGSLVRFYIYRYIVYQLQQQQLLLVILRLLLMLTDDAHHQWLPLHPFIIPTRGYTPRLYSF